MFQQWVRLISRLTIRALASGSRIGLRRRWSLFGAEVVPLLVSRGRIREVRGVVAGSTSMAITGLAGGIFVGFLVLLVLYAQ